MSVDCQVAALQQAKDGTIEVGSPDRRRTTMTATRAGDDGVAWQHCRAEGVKVSWVTRKVRLIVDTDTEGRSHPKTLNDVTVNGTVHCCEESGLAVAQ